MESIDARGKACPLPVMLAKKVIDTGAEELEITVDNETAVKNLMNLAKRSGFAASTAQTEDNYTTVHMTRTAESAAVAAAIANVKTAEVYGAESGLMPVSNDYVVFISREIIGAGDPTLGHTLMKMALLVLSESDDLPQAVLFMNDGVKVATSDDAEVIAHIKKLEERGVEVLVCGTCLNFYDLTEKCQVGTVSNMYDILGWMQQLRTITL